MARPLTYIIICNWNGKEIMHKCLTSLFSNTIGSDFRVLVVDNASTDDSIEMVKKDFPQVKFVLNKTNAGFSVANNQGIKLALSSGANQILLLNNDIEILDTNWLIDLTNLLWSDCTIGIVGCKLFFPDGRIQHAGGIVSLRGAYHRGERETDQHQYDIVGFVDYVTGAALLIKAEVIQKIGLLDEGFTPLYCEDTDWCVRAGLYGYKTLYTSNPALVHHCGLSAAKLGNTKNNFYYRRSAIRFFLLNFQLSDILRRLLKFELPALIACFIGRKHQGYLHIILRSDASARFFGFLNAWVPSICDLKGIITKRRQRFLCKKSFPLSV